MKEVSLFVMSRKGYTLLKDIIDDGYAPQIDKVVIAHDKAMANDYYEEMYNVCKDAGVDVHDKTEKVVISSPYCIAIAWRWIIPLKEETKLIVFHDSILPKYRGFAPLVNMLINKEPLLGVTALYASEEYDRGEIINQKTTAVSYPIKITDAIDLVTPLYSELMCDILNKLRNNEQLISRPQIETECTYSLWRDEDDYHIDWSESAEDVLQFIYSVGYPFKGASTMMEDEIIRIIDAEIYPDVKIENRQVGKVIFIEHGAPVIICGSGLLKITSAVSEDGESVLPFKKFRVRLR